MKKWLFAAGATALLLAGCGEEKKSEATKQEQSSDESVNVEKGLLNVEVTLPASFFEDTTEEEIMTGAKEEGFTETTVNEDGSVTYKMSKSKHKEMMKELEDGIVESIKEIVESGDYPSIKEISYNKSFDEFDVKVDRELYENGFDGFAILGIVMTGAYYSAFNGDAAEDLKLTFNMIDAATDEIYETAVYPDDWEETEEAE
ncbi:hypothetical protein [Lysinibacillus sp. 3P01SB]|uniref:hypothetical protein n=1 Tax=Lysinibacillus sp. 3P01SB TaxID=3132284 RepID=UPI0039A5EA0E